MNLDKSLAFYKDRFADASDFTFVFVGSFDLATIKPLVERYLASLPALHRNETAKDVGMRPPAGVVEKQVQKGIEPKSQVSIVFTGPFENDELHRVIVRAMAETLGGNLQQHAAGGSRRHLRRQRRAAVHEASDGGISPDDQLRAAIRRASTSLVKTRVPRDRRSSRRVGPSDEPGGRRARRRWRGTSRPTASGTSTC